MDTELRLRIWSLIEKRNRAIRTSPINFQRFRLAQSELEEVAGQAGIKPADLSELEAQKVDASFMSRKKGGVLYLPENPSPISIEPDSPTAFVQRYVGFQIDDYEPLTEEIKPAVQKEWLRRGKRCFGNQEADTRTLIDMNFIGNCT